MTCRTSASAAAERCVNSRLCDVCGEGRRWLQERSIPPCCAASAAADSSVRHRALAIRSPALARTLLIVSLPDSSTPRVKTTDSGRYSTRGHAAAQAKSRLRRCGLDAVPASKARGERTGRQENLRAGSRPESTEAGGERSKRGQTQPARRPLPPPLLEPCSGPARAARAVD